MKFSIIVPVYNVEKYIDKCLSSIEKQTFRNFEVIIINDGSTDNSQIIVDKYVKTNIDNFKSFIKENGGLSDARNYGIERATGEYLIFVDSDDYIDENFLEEINSKIENEKDLELIRIPKVTINEKNKVLEKENLSEKVLTGQEAFCELRKKKICIETAWSYCVKKSFWKENDFKFPKSRVHEDFGTMINVILRAKKVGFINTTYYKYLIRENSIMTNTSKEKEVKKVYDKLYHYDIICKELNNIGNISDKTKDYCLEYISTAMFESYRKLDKNERKKYKEELKKRDIIRNIKFYDGFDFKILIKKINYSLMLY